ncbi:MAG: phage terminase large subunit [Magnetococcales bacterium]|nr:phage terminase large subunit [Magnetococcales bacterium]NGZ05840.1 phage terminase large subunit [Magnetococcales bacterium]
MWQPGNKGSRRFREELAELGSSLRTAIADRVAGFDDEPEATIERRSQVMVSLRFFARLYFPHYVSAQESILHQWLYERLPRLGEVPGKGSKLAVAAPRGEAKSTLITQIFGLWRVITGRSRYILIIMDAYHQAATMLEAMKAELEVNPRLRRDFPEHCGIGRVWREGVAVTRSGIKVQAVGSGARLRGLRHGAARPDLVVCDDLENDDNVRVRVQRDKLENWMKKAVLKLGPPDDSLDVVYVGTVLHHDSVLARILANPFWESRRFQAIVRWPDAMGLWQEWQQILQRAGEAEADHFYRERQAEMDAGAQLSWPGMRTLETLMKMRARDGADAFDAEMQNQPMQENAPFGQLTFWQEPGADWLYFGAVDPSMGKSGGQGDPSAILVGGWERSSGVLHVVEADIQRRSPDRIIEDVIGFQSRYACRLWVVESVQFQEFFKDELVRRAARIGIPVPARGIRPSRDKGLRIGALQPHVANGLIRFRPEQQTLLDQLRHWGEPDAHDDGPDALEMLWRAVREGGSSQVGEFQALGENRMARSIGLTEERAPWHGF